MYFIFHNFKSKIHIHIGVGLGISWLSETQKLLYHAYESLEISFNLIYYSSPYNGNK